MTQDEAEKILLAWAQVYCPNQFNTVKIDGYSYDRVFTFTKEESKDAAQ